MTASILLKTENITVQIANKPICQALNLEIKAGEFWGVLGQNGSGKTTLLHSLAGLHPLKAGEIYLADKRLSSYPAKKRAQLLSVLFQQNPMIFPQTVWDYCLAGRYPHFTSFRASQEDWTSTQSALEIMQLDQQKSQNILTLSGGEWRRLALATILAQNTRLYLLDEPLNHLDLRHQKQLLQHLQGLTQQKKIAVLMTMHDINMAEQYCDRVLLLFGENEAQAGLKRALMTENNLSRLYGHPLRLMGTLEKPWWLVE